MNRAQSHLGWLAYHACEVGLRATAPMMLSTGWTSIVTPTRNRRSLLEWTLRSVRGQTYPNLEHIVVDGGSTDGTIELVQAWLRFRELLRQLFISAHR